MINWKGSCLLAVALLAGCGNDSDTSEEPRLSGDSLSRFATLAFDCITVEYPNKLNQVLRDENSLRPPRELHPAFYGCFDWHSAVHGHWAMVRVLRRFPSHPLAPKLRAALERHVTPERLAGELAYFRAQKLDDAIAAAWTERAISVAPSV